VDKVEPLFGPFAQAAAWGIASQHIDHDNGVRRCITGSVPLHNPC